MGRLAQLASTTEVRAFVVVLGTTLGFAPVARAAEPSIVIDLASVPTDSGGLLRIHGRAGNGAFGVPVAPVADCDGDGLGDLAMSSMLADPSGRTDAGEVHLLFGDGTMIGAFDAAVPQSRLLTVIGDGTRALTGSEVWLDDVTGDRIADLLIAQQNRRAAGDRPGAGAVVIVTGGPALRALAATLAVLDLAAPPDSIVVTTILGAEAIGRFGVWLRTGDVSGDGVADIAVGADQESLPGGTHQGAVYLIRGGNHLATGTIADLADLAGEPLTGHVAKVLPPAGANEFHLGGTCQLADLDGNGRAELLAAAALNRFNCSVEAEGAPDGSAHPTGGPTDGRFFIAWDDNFAVDPWPTDFSFAIDAAPGSVSTVRGANANVTFGEELLGGFDADNDGASDLFVGDLVANLTGTRPQAGAGYVVYDAASLRGRTLDLDSLPVDLAIATILGGSSGEIAGDTAAAGDFDGDGLVDLMLSAPHGSPLARQDAGTISVLFGRNGRWPEIVDLATGLLPAASAVRIAQVHGANGTAASDAGDVLAYSAAHGDVDGDGRDDIVTNEMMGNGTTVEAVDVGNLIAINGTLIAGSDGPPSCASEPSPVCRQVGEGASFLRLARGVTQLDDRLNWSWESGQSEDVTVFHDPLGTIAASYRICVYSASDPERAISQGVVPSGGQCAGTQCWKPIGGDGYVFVDPSAGRDGVRRIKLRTRDGVGTFIRLRARGPLWRAANLPLALPVTVRFFVASAGQYECWEAAYSSAAANEPDVFRSRRGTPGLDRAEPGR